MSRLNAMRKAKEATVKSHWPVTVRRLFATLNEIPWGSLAALSAMVGGIVLFLYFRSIGYVPTDLSALFGLGITSSIVSLALLVGFAFVLFAPTWMYQHGLMEIDTSFKQASRMRVSVDLAGLQFGALGVWLLKVAYNEFICNGSPIGWLIVGAVFFVWGIYSLSRLTKIPNGFRRRLWSFWYAILIGFCGVVPIVALLPIQLALAPSGDSAVWVLLGLFVLVISFNAFVAPAFGSRTAGVFALAFAFYLLIVVPLVGGNPVFFPTLVAQVLGVREAEIQELHVPQKTCQLLLSTIESSASQIVKCSAGDWGVVKAQVLSNVGERWLIEIRKEDTNVGGEANYLRVTIPQDGVQTIRQKMSVSNAVRKNTCKRGG